MNKCYQPEFYVLGDRKYIQGGSQIYLLLDALNTWGIQGIKRIAGTFHEFLRTEGHYWLFSNKQEQIDSNRHFVSNYIIDTDMGKIYVGLEKRDSIVSKSVPYEEETLINQCEIDGQKRSISCARANEEQLIYRLIAMTKKMHLQLLPRDEKTKWNFCGFDLGWPIITTELTEADVNVALAAVIENTYTRSYVIVNGKRIGYILFAREVI